MPLSSEFLLEARELGLLGPGPVEIHDLHSRGFLEALKLVWNAQEQPRLLDLGSGGGVPGMILAELWPDSDVSLLESSKRKCEFLEGWIDRAGWGSRVRVLCGRAESLGRDPDLRGRFDAVVVRSFGRPSVTAECSAPFLCVEGLLIVSDPPEPASGDAEPGVQPRWPASGLRLVGLETIQMITEPFHFTILRQVERCPDRYPRRTGIPTKRPLF